MQLTLMTVFGFLISFSLIVPGPVLRSVKGDLDGVFQQAPSVQKAQTSGDRGWPRGYSLPSEAQMVVYQPQIATWDDQKHAVGFAAISYVAKGEQKPALGTIRLWHL